jgi:hypothetical protein
MRAGMTTSNTMYFSVARMLHAKRDANKAGFAGKMPALRKIHPYRPRVGHPHDVVAKERDSVHEERSLVSR